jgi:predicted  nucleic acid-binding Zn-ribbon protein
MGDTDKKPMTIDDLAVMVATGFNDVTGRMATKDDVAQISGRIDKLEGRMGEFEGKMDKLDHRMEALNSNVNNYLELSEKRYAELKQRDALLAKWLKLIAEKTGVPIDISLLEKV